MEGATPIGAKTVSQRAKEGPFGRNKIYQEIAAGRLKAKKAGRNTVITDAEWGRYMDSLPDFKPGEAA
jgi:hypothetical protein